MKYTAKAAPPCAKLATAQIGSKVLNPVEAISPNSIAWKLWCIPEITIAEYNPPKIIPANIPKWFNAYCKNTLIPSPIQLANGPTTTKAKNPVANTVNNGVNNISNMLGTIFLTFLSIIDIKNITNNIGNTVPWYPFKGISIIPNTDIVWATAPDCCSQAFIKPGWIIIPPTVAAK